jgi:DNA polymerase-1
VAAPLLIVDLPWLLYRSHFALPSSVVDDEGRRAGALRGSIESLLALVGPDGPLTVRAVAICSGAEEAAYRVAAFPPYHAHRDPMPTELREQFARAPALLGAFGFALYDGGELEADDVINALARGESRAGGLGLIISADRDLYGAVDESVAVLELRRGQAPGLIDIAGVVERSGVRPEQIPDLIALRGDPSDGIPGAKGIGAKGAAALLAEYGTLEESLAAAGRGEVAGRAGASLVAQHDQLLMFKWIATLQLPAVEVPADSPLDLAAGAGAAEADGLGKLAARIRRLAGATG